MLIDRALRWSCRHLPRGASYLLGSAYAGVLREYTFAGPDFPRYWNRLRRTEWAPRDLLERLQWLAFKRLLDHAWRNVPFYRRRFAEAGITPDDIRSREDLARIPPLTRDDVRLGADELLADGVRREDLFLKKTSGSSGDSLRVYYDLGCYRGVRAAVARWRTMAGCDPFRSRVAASGNYSPHPHAGPSTFTRYDPVDNILYLPSTTLHPRALDEYVSELRAFRPAILQGVGSTFYIIACYMLDRRAPCPGARAVLASGDLLLPRHREVIREATGAEVYNSYGMVERTVSAAECSERRGMHVDMDLCMMEVVDADGRAVSGSPGAILGTNLVNYAMPLIRYRTGDVGTLSRRWCPCGRESWMLESLDGRTGDLLRAPNGFMIGAGGVGNMVKHMPALREFHVIQHAPDRFEVITAWDRGLAPDVEGVRQAFREALGADAAVEVRVTDSIPRTSAGKLKLIVSRLGVDPPIAASARTETPPAGERP